MKKIIFLIFITQFFSCKKNKTIQYIKQGSSEEICIPYDSISRDYYKYNIALSDKSETKLYGFQRETNTIDVFIFNQARQKHIKFNREGPNSIKEFVSFNVINSDSIIIQDSSRLLISDNNGDIYFKHSFDSIPNEIPKGRIISRNGSPITIHNGKVYFIYSPDQLRFRSEEWFEYPLFMSYDLINKKYETLPIYYTDFVKENKGDFGYNLWPHFTIANNKLIYNFPYQPEIYTYDIKSKQISVFNDSNSCFANDYSESISYKADFFEKETNYMENRYFSKIIYDKDNNYFYRFNKGPLQYKVSDVEFNEPMDKPLFLSVYNVNFSLINEFSFDKHTYEVNMAFTSNGKLYISKSHPKNVNLKSDLHCFDILDLKRINKLK